uniref:Uncharacterized protein n=1 Tax=viral metagenome TaxID=1070528 RepID=A0A6M3LUM6_9ZZZZ
MKAILEIELEIDGEWLSSDKDRLIEMIFNNPGNGVWEIDEDRLAVLANSMKIELED